MAELLRCEKCTCTELDHIVSEKLVQVTKQQVYGVDKYYPANTMAKLAVDLVGTKQVTDSMIYCLKSYGYTVQVIGKSETL